MEVLVTDLRCQIASLETRLVCANQEKQKLQDTVVCLSNVLSSYTQNAHSKPIDQDHFKKSVAAIENPDESSITNDAEALQVISSSNQNSSPEPDYHSQPTTITDKQSKDDRSSGTLDLIELITSSPDITSIHAALGDKPPILDLKFKGIRTALDGPERSTTRAGSSESQKTLSFDEIYGQLPIVNQARADIPSVVDQVTIPAIHETREDSVSNVKASDTKRGRLNRHGLARRSPRSSHESSSTKSSDSFHKPLSVLHGIRFKPKEDNSSTNTQVMVFNLPRDTSVAAVLSKIRGGVVVSCVTLDTAFSHNSSSAIVRFSTHSEALFCVDHAATMPLVFEGRKALIRLIPTPTYPLAPDIHQNIFEYGHTRCLRINGFHRIKNYYAFKNYTNPHHIEYQATNDLGDWFVRFTSLKRASALWADLKYFRVQNLGGGFMPDPCDVEESLDLAAWKAKDIKAMEMGTLDWKV